MTQRDPLSAAGRRVPSPRHAVTPVHATEQAARDAAVRQAALTEQGLHLSRRQLSVGLIGISLTAVFGWLGIAASKDYWPFDTAGTPNTRESVQLLAADLAADSPERRRAAVAALAARTVPGHVDRDAAIAALVAFLRKDHTAIRQQAKDGKTPPELSDAFTVLGQANVRSDQVDLRYADLAGIDVRSLNFPEGLPLYGANLSRAVITTSKIGGCNASTVDLSNAWLGACELTAWNLIDAKLAGGTFPGTLFNGCVLAGADLTGADFASTTFKACDFDGRTLIAAGQNNPVTWDPANPPTWPHGFSLPR